VRVLVAHPGPNFSVHDLYVGWTEALRVLGHQVFEFNLGDRLALYAKAHVQTDEGGYRKAFDDTQAVQMAMNGLAAGLFKIRPQVLLIVSGFFVDGQLLDQARRSGTRVVALMTEAPYETERELKLAAHVDLCLVNDPTHIAQYQAVTPTVYAPHSYRPGVHCPGPTGEKPSDLVFCGTGYPSRIAFLEQMDLSGLAVSIGGNWMRLAEDSPLRPCLVHPVDECLDNADTVALYRASRCGLNLYRVEANQPEFSQGWAMGPREVELAATGLFFLRDPRPEGDEVLGMLPTFGSPEEASELLRYYLAHDSQREALALKAREAIEDRTFTNHAAKLLRLLGVEE
jgi:spore maturation protein CgeB